jgi:hypothetical protein
MQIMQEENEETGTAHWNGPIQVLLTVAVVSQVFRRVS